MALAFKARGLTDNAAMRANGLSIWPADRFEMSAGGSFVMENGIGQIGHRLGLQ